MWFAVTLKQLRALSAVAETGGVTSAARKLAVTPPAISMQLRLLEDMAGLALLDRAGDRFVPTQAGKEAVAAAVAIEAELAELAASLATQRDGLGGRVNIGLVSTAKYFAPQMIGAFARAHPGASVSLTVGSRATIIAALRDFSIDAAIMGRPPADQPVEAHTIGDHPHLIVAEPRHRLAGVANLPPGVLAQETFVVREPNSGTRTLMERYFAEAEVAPIMGMEIDSNETIKQAVMAGLGIGFISAHTVAVELGDHRLVRLDIRGLPVVRKWFVVRRTDKRLSPISQAMVDFIVAEGARFLPSAPWDAPTSPFAARRDPS